MPVLGFLPAFTSKVGQYARNHQRATGQHPRPKALAEQQGANEGGFCR